MRFLKWLLGLFGYSCVKTDDLKQMKDRVDYYKEDQTFMRERYFSLVDAYNDLNAKYEEIGGTSLFEQKKINDELRSHQDKLEADLKQAEEYYKTVQETVHMWGSGDYLFGFDRNPSFPGAATLTTSKFGEPVVNGQHVAISGRVVFTDEMTEQLRRYVSMGDKYWAAINYMMKYKLTDKILEYILTSGVMQLTFAYNPECTAAELYYNLQMLKPQTPFVFDVDVNKSGGGC